MKYLHYTVGILFTFCLMTALLITSVEAVAYWIPGYYEREYERYQVTEVVGMEMEDLLDVTREMMAYLRGNREDLHVPAIVNGQAREFFNEREISHMEDVRGLFLGGLLIRRICVITAILCVAVLLALKAKVGIILPRAICGGTGLFFAAVCGLAALISTDFTKYFVIFHQIFFDNDLWLLDPRTDLLINIVPEPFFVDTAANIAVIFAGSVLLIFFLCLFLIRKKRGKKDLAAGLAVTLVLGLTPSDALAAEPWPDNISIQAEGGIVMDADTGTVLFGKNIHNTYFPASITKILTALIVIERCDLDEMVTFSHDAVYNVEAGSSSAGLDVGDVLSVRDCLYALLLKSANEAANALAEHVAGSVDAFAELMNAKADSLGCQDSHFANPSGLNNPEHYTSAYDMALIGRAALQNSTFMEIDSSLYYHLPVTRNNREGLTVYPGHKMIKKNMPEYYSGALGGKTGYTSLAGNTLVTFARRGDMTLVAVILNGHSTHYSDTKAMLNFGFQNFLTVSVADFDTGFASLENDLTIAGLSPTGLSGLEMDPSMKLTVPKDADFSSVNSVLSYDLAPSDPLGTIAKIQYSWNDRDIGFTYLTVKSMSPDQVMMPPAVASLAESGASRQAAALNGDGISGQALAPDGGSMSGQALAPGEGAASRQGGEVTGEELLSAHALDTQDPEGGGVSGDQADGQPADSSLVRSAVSWLGAVPILVWLALAGTIGAAGAACAGILSKQRLRRKEEEAKLLRRQRRLERLEQLGISTEHFEYLVQQRRSKAAGKSNFLKKQYDDSI